MEGCGIISKIDVETPERLAGANLVSLVRSRQVCELVQNRFEQLSWLGWVIGGALLFRAHNVAYLGAALASVAGGMVCSERARSYGQLVETYKEVEAWSAETVKQSVPAVDTTELQSEAGKMVEALKKEDLNIVVKHVLLLHAVSELQLKIADAARQMEVEPKVPARLACWKAHAAKGISPLW